ncbi:DUF3093 domain-containing protein [Ruania alba]|uniref:DUF3093 domain-containing protein n=1 Tax=Ruania alba TaxID=648782 RepID=A0A1H5FJR8_9MICO|nr:DUF3093 domain-containing protein [Ruania alba]SEE03645.1 Protein of unknown function [Ruania alba]
MTDSFTERVLPSTTGWLLAPAAGVLVAIALLPVDARLAAAVAIVVAAGAAAVLVLVSPRIVVDDEALHVDRTHLPLGVIGAIEPLAGTDLEHAMGPGLDARAHVRFRAWAPSAVRITVADSSDPTPYWIVSTRNPDELRRALRTDR